MLKNRQFIGFIGAVAVLGGLWSSQAIAQSRPSTEFFQGRGVAQGAAFSQGRNANVSLTLDGNNFGLEMTEPQAANRSRAPGRVQYRGAIVRRTPNSGGPNNFTLTTRVRSFDSSEIFRVLPNTTGTCRIEVFDARVIYSNCTTVADDGSTRFLGLEQF
jgi:hypothetical protein